MPLIMIGSFFVLLVNFPIPAWTNLIQPYVPSIMLPYRITVGLMALYASYGMGYSLAKSYDLDGISSGSLSLGTFLMTMTPVIGKAVEGDLELGWVLPMNFWVAGNVYRNPYYDFSSRNFTFCKEKKCYN